MHQHDPRRLLADSSPWRRHALGGALLAALAAASACAPMRSGVAPGGTAPMAAPAAAAKPETSAASAAPPPSRVAAAASGPQAAPPRPATAASGPGTTPPGAAVVPPPAPGQPPPFATVMKDAKEIKGLFNAWQKDEKVWLELKPEDFNKPFFLSPKLTQGIGEAFLYGGLMLPSPRLVQWRRIHNLVQLVAINTTQVAKAGTPEARAVASAISPSLLAAVPVASAAHPERKSVLIDASSVFVSDMLGLAGVLQRAFRQGYNLEGRNSMITAVRGKPELTVIEVTSHYATGSIAVPTPGTPPGVPMPSVPSGLADPRSMLLGLHYSLAKLPDEPMAKRAADPRVGYFMSVTDDYSDDLARAPRQRFVNRWRLEKKDQAAAMSVPVKPITYWIDRNVPLKYRATITAGIMEWNKAFEQAGFKNAIEVKQQPDDADWDTLDAGIASVRWMLNRDVSFGAIGPSHVDPRSGEILDADIGIEGLSSRNIRSARARVLGGNGSGALASALANDWARLMQVGGAVPSDSALPGGMDHTLCLHGDLAAEQLGYGMDVLLARGEIDPDSPEAQQFVLDYLKDVTMHEVGHTLGLRHNFRASHIYSDRQVRDPEFTKAQAFTGSVMEYAPINLPRSGEPTPAPFQTTLGPYDYWAIEYAYKPIAADQEVAELARIAGRSGEPELAFGTDEDNFLGIDPEALHMDLGDDPVAFAERRFDIANELFERQEKRVLRPGEDFASLRRSLLYAARDAARSTGVLLRQIGGLRTLRDYANTGRDPLQPVPAFAQRAALATITKRVLSADSFVVSPALQRRLAPDFFERAEGVTGMATEFSLSDSVLELQRTLLNQLMGDTLARRVLDNEARTNQRNEAFRLGELYQQLDTALWSELATPGSDISTARRNLQREHINRLAALVLRPGALGRTDARGLVRQEAQSLLARLEKAQNRAVLSPEARLHVKDSAESLRLSLAAKLDRTAP